MNSKHITETQRDTMQNLRVRVIFMTLLLSLYFVKREIVCHKLQLSLTDFAGHLAAPMCFSPSNPIGPEHWDERHVNMWCNLLFVYPTYHSNIWKGNILYTVLFTSNDNKKLLFKTSDLSNNILMVYSVEEKKKKRRKS